jgi:DNA-binding response OmpR family regulator
LSSAAAAGPRSRCLKIARAMGADQVLAKPFSIDEIAALLASVMAGDP